MLFEWDENKRRANVAKHGIDFLLAMDVFDGRPAYEYPSRFVTEERFVTVAYVNGMLAAVVWTWREEETIRIISARSARDGEKRAYRALHG